MKRFFILLFIPLLIISCNENLSIPDAKEDEINESNYMDYYWLMKKLGGEVDSQSTTVAAYTKAMADQLNDFFLNRGMTVYPARNEADFPSHVKWNYTSKTDEDYITWGTLSGDNWMKFISDDQLVRNMTIPGTHDSYTWTLKDDGLMDECGCTQGVSDISQFNFGCRCFDIRIDADNGEIQHGYSIFACETGIQLHEALGSIIAFVKNHPTEGVFVVLNKEFNAGDTENLGKTIADEVKKCRNGWASTAKKGIISDNDFLDVFLPYRDNLTMGELRGHIVVFVRTNLQNLGPEGFRVQNEILHATHLSLTDDLAKGVYTGKDFFGHETNIICQDYYAVSDLGKKMDELKYAMMAKSGQYGSTVQQYKDMDAPNTWAFNHASGYTGSLAEMSYNENAEYVLADTEGRGSYLLRTLRGPFGFLIQDFCGVEKFDPGTWSTERETYGRHFSSYAWQHNFYDDSADQYYVMSEEEGKIDWDRHSYQYCDTKMNND